MVLTKDDQEAIQVELTLQRIRDEGDIDVLLVSQQRINHPLEGLNIHRMLHHTFYDILGLQRSFQVQLNDPAWLWRAG